MGGNRHSGLRKGAWTAEEDMLLKNCIEKFGEGKWHLVPLKAGLNRCRKSCRLRWLNYLRPNIKRGDFGEDEIDLILRLHKLLGNRWSLIAGRIPGRTANDVKNYWNTHLRSRHKQQKKEPKDNESSRDTMITVVKPQPRTFSKTLNSFQECTATHNDEKLIISSKDGVGNNITMSPGLISSPIILGVDEINDHWDSLFEDHEKKIDGQVGINVVEQEDGRDSLFDFSVDDVVWNLLNLE